MLLTDPDRTLEATVPPQDEQGIPDEEFVDPCPLEERVEPRD